MRDIKIGRDGLGPPHNRIEGSADLQSWQVIEAQVTGNGGTISRLYSTKDIPQRYFRVRRN